MSKRFRINSVLFVPVVIFLSVSLLASGKSFGSSGMRFDDKSALLDFRRGGGEGLGGAAWLDYDRDGDLDLFITNSQNVGNLGPRFENGLFRNNNDGSFTDVSEQAGITNGLGNTCVVVGDLDNDGYPDIVLCGDGNAVAPFIHSPVKVYRNQQDGTFLDISWKSRIRSGGTEWGAALADINNDGYLDLFIASPGHIPFVRGFGGGRAHPNKLYLNNGDLTFTDISQSAGITGLYVDEATGITASDGACAVGFSDYDVDNLVDIIVANCNAFKVGQRIYGKELLRATPFNLFRNNGDHTFTDVATEAGLDTLGFWMAMTFGDFNNDGHIDFFSTSTGTASDLLYPHALMRNNGDGTFIDITDNELAETPFSWGATAADFDNDGDLDLFKAGSLPAFGVIDSDASPGEFFRNEGGNRGFVADLDATDIDLSMDNVSGVAQGDFNGDGFPDVVVIRSAFQTSLPPFYNFDFDIPNGQPVLLQNKGNSNGWLTIRPVGTASNSMGIGARIEVFSPSNPQFRQVREVRAGSSFASSESPWPTFGLGPFPVSNYSVRVSWPSGLVEVFTSVRSRQVFEVVEGTGSAE